MDTFLQNTIQQSLQLHLYANSIFLSERLYSESKTLTNLHTLATCYFLSGKVSTVYNFLKFKSAEWKTNCPEKLSKQATKNLYYLFGVCCVKLQKYEEAENVFRQLQLHHTDAAVNYWLGIICRYTNRTNAAINFFQKALQLNPLLWCAFENLCQLGADVNTASLFHASKAQQLLAQQSVVSVPSAQKEVQFTTPIVSQEIPLTITPQPQFTPVSTPQSESSYQSVQSTPPVTQKKNLSPVPEFSFSTPLAVSLNTPKSNITPTPTRPVLKSPALVPRKKTKTHRLRNSNVSKKVAGKLFDSGKKYDAMSIEKSPRLSTGSKHDIFKTPTPLKQTPHQTPQQSSVSFDLTQSAPNIHHVQQPLLSSQITQSSAQKENSAVTQKGVKLADVQNVLALLRTLGEAYRLFCQYRCKEAIQVFSTLSKGQYSTGWVLTQIGRSYFEMADYINAEKAFEEVTKLEPHRLDGLEVYSTILWHLKKEKQLCYLAHRMSEIDKLSPNTLCSIGNCFSLQKDHETALKFFQRATKVNNLFTYAFTLAGHEHYANDDLEEALQCYRNAIRVDSRHYNAWYGLGTVYYRQEKYELAEYHFRRALQINPRSSVLYCYLGMTLSSSKKYTEALQMLQSAINIHPQNPMAKFKKANVLISLKQYQTALIELESLKEIAPKESSVYFTMGKIYKKLNQKDKALYHFNMALDLEAPPKDNPLIKTAISKLFADPSNDEENSSGDENDDMSLH